tara:strand:+ start:16418 stop:19015 length:2598 start_codon:yes stop_codon:yes gene_type:complete
MIKNLLNRNLSKYTGTISEINLCETDLRLLNDSELKEYSLKLRKQYQNEQNLSKILTKSFAVTRESARRTLDLRHFDVQLLGGLVLNDGKIAEMKTGEGKTLVATLPAYLNSLTGDGVHVVTVNDYLAKRDQNWMGQIHRFLGLNVGLIQESTSRELRTLNYNSDITYITNSELGFDYLRDNMVKNSNEVVQRKLNYCIVDEVDSILIDEARTPLVISDIEKTGVNKYVIAAELIKYLEVKVHFEIDEKKKNIIITENGIVQAQNLLKINDLFNQRDPWMPFVINALKAQFLFLKDIDYIVQSNQIIIVDGFTGRIMPDRRWSDDLHQAIEAKESVAISGSTINLASITYQNFFCLYSKLSGMSGTAKTDQAEFEKIYKLPVVSIPTAKSYKREDLPDLVYSTEFIKWKSIAQECEYINSTGQPILIGTTSIEKSEILAQLLDDSGLKYQILNAKPENIKKESEIIAQAGERFNITIATNMAGRGTDIILGGNPKFKTKKLVYEMLIQLKNNSVNDEIINSVAFENQIKGFQSDLKLLSSDLKFFEQTPIDLLKLLNKIEGTKSNFLNFELVIQNLYKLIYTNIKINQQTENERIRKLGGLFVMGTARHDSVRIDNQLRGRCGRQGDPGTSRFFLSFDDSVLRLYGNNNFLKKQIGNDGPMSSKLLTRMINVAQKKLENQNYDIRKQVTDYDDVLNKQRLVIFDDRRDILLADPISVKKKIEQIGTSIIRCIIGDSKNYKELPLIFENLLGIPIDLNNFKKGTEIELYLTQQYFLSYELKEAEIEIYTCGLIRNIEQQTFLAFTDSFWKEHLENMSLLRDAVGWRAYGQRNPLFEYKEEGYLLFSFLLNRIRHLTIFSLLHLKPI